MLIVDAPSSYNGILGRTALNKLKAIVSTYSLMMGVRIVIRLFSIQWDRYTGRECFIAAKVEVEHSIAEEKMRGVEDQNKKVQPQWEFELFEVDNTYPNRRIRIRKTLPEKSGKEVCDILMDFREIFSWSPSDLGIILWDTFVNRLGILEDATSAV